MAYPFPAKPVPGVAARECESAVKPRPKFEVADILRAHLREYFHGHNHPLHVHKVLGAIGNCRTVVLGGHVDCCTECGALQISYNSCLMGSTS